MPPTDVGLNVRHVIIARGRPPPGSQRTNEGVRGVPVGPCNKGVKSRAVRPSYRQIDLLQPHSEPMGLAGYTSEKL